METELHNRHSLSFRPFQASSTGDDLNALAMWQPVSESASTPQPTASLATSALDVSSAASELRQRVNSVLTDEMGAADKAFCDDRWIENQLRLSKYLKVQPPVSCETVLKQEKDATSILQVRTYQNMNGKPKLVSSKRHLKWVDHVSHAASRSKPCSKPCKAPLVEASMGPKRKRPMESVACKQPTKMETESYSLCTGSQLVNAFAANSTGVDQNVLARWQPVFESGRTPTPAAAPAISAPMTSSAVPELVLHQCINPGLTNGCEAVDEAFFEIEKWIENQVENLNNLKAQPPVSWKAFLRKEKYADQKDAFVHAHTYNNLVGKPTFSSSSKRRMKWADHVSKGALCIPCKRPHIPHVWHDVGIHQ